jgi:hypothetical protein
VESVDISTWKNSSSPDALDANPAWSQGAAMSADARLQALARDFHISINVQIYRAGGRCPACDGPDCPVCPLIVKLLESAAEPQWQPIETAPKMRNILLFAVTDIAVDGTVKNWKMGTGSWHTGYEDALSMERGYTPWTWNGDQVKVYEVQPTHWMPLPQGPKA